MAHVYRKIIFAFVFGFISCVSSTPKTVATVPPNVAIFKKPYDQVWKVVINTVTLKHLMPLEVMMANQGTFSTKLIREENTFQPSRYRLSGTVLPSTEGVVVTLYNQQEIFENNHWRAVQSSYDLEKSLLNAISLDLSK